MTDEEWRPVVNYEGCYEVSNRGRVKSLKRTILRSNGITQGIPERILKSPPSRYGYPEVRLYPPAGGKLLGRTYFVHRLMLEAFVGPCPPNHEGTHLNDVPGDNRLENLRWGTSSGNSYDLVRNGNHGMARKTHCKWGHRLAPPNLRKSAWERGRRICMACTGERSESRRQHREFDPARAMSRFEELWSGVDG